MSQELKVIPAEDITKRFDKLEVKIDALSEALVIMARNEEKVIAMQDRLTQQGERLNRHSEKLDKLEKIVSSNAVVVKLMVTFIGALLAAGAGSLWMI